MLSKAVLIDILLAIEELADKDLQQERWGRVLPTGPLSSYLDLRDCLLKDHRAIRLVRAEPEEYGIDVFCQKELGLLLFKLMLFNGKGKSEDEILKDREWDAVVAQAKDVFKLLRAKDIIKLIE